MNREEIKNKIEQIKQKAYNKRWRDSEIKKILEYLQENREFERPTAQIFYRKLLETTNIDATWNIVRWKVRHLRINYNKAETWRKSTGAELLETNEGITFVRDKLIKICRFYEELHNIFGQKSSEFPFQVFDTGTTTNIALNGSLITEDTLENENNFSICEIVEESCIKLEDQNNEDDSLDISEVSDYEISASSTLCKNLPTQTPTSGTQPLEREPKNKAPKRTIDQLSATQEERNLYLKEKLDFEKEKFKIEFTLKEKRFAEEIEERKAKYEFKKLELEKQERIERFEIEMKYKYYKLKH